MRCPFCQHEDTQVKDSRPTEDGAAIRRRRQCDKCGARFTTFERVQLRELIVVKKSGRRAPFDREKLTRSVMIALRKRPIDGEQVDQLVSGIVRRLESAGEAEIPSREIGEMVMEALANLDPVAYVRYASVYRDFRDANDFADILDDPQLGGAQPAGGAEPKKRT
ncbi:MAG: transcriptional repressor NrdR [Alphaproteobacteria bacterium]|nr:transcriptional repressor NrdR [Alphaproteobacteria bacterium]